MWVSTNKVLIGSVGGLKKPHCRNPNFDCEETKLLISLWGDPQVQRTLITTHKKHPVIAKLAEKMREYGYNRSTEEINTRIKNLKCFYNRIKKDLDTGVINEPSWKHFQAMDEILTRPVFGGANAASRYPPTPGAAGSSDATSSSAGGGGRTTRPRLSGGSMSGAELSELDPDQIEVKLELVSDEEKELHPEDLLKNAEQVELKEPNLLIPKDEPMEEDEDDPNDPDFEDDGGSETDDESSGMDEADESDRSTRLRRRTRRAHKPKKSNTTSGSKIATSSTSNGGTNTTTTTTNTSTASQPAAVPGTIKIINYAGGGSISLSSVANVVSAVSTGSSTVSITTLAGKSDAMGTTTTTTTTPSKISLVPTNFLLKPQTSNLGFKQPIQLYTKPTVSIGTTKPTPGLSPIVSVNASVGGLAPSTTSTVASAGGTAGGAPMKVFLVNTLAKDGSGPKQQLITPSTAKQIYTTSAGVSLQGTSHVSGLPQISIQPKQLLTSGSGAATTISRKILQTTTVPPLRSSLGTAAPPKLGGFKALLQQLVGLQRENLGITKTRLVAEKERFGNEKIVANSLLDALGELNALLTEVNGEMMTMGKESEDDEEDGMIKISSESPASSPRRSASRHEDSVKPEVISDSEES
uniref:Myb/SANT-like DNA-binding domain-containing protein n=1 Tax=Anopheles christyi TaxID=43041 RepID=A0A182JRT9_9DIPT